MSANNWRRDPIETCPDVGTLIQQALDEDIGSGDATSLAVIAASDRCRGRIVSRGHAVVSGIMVAARVFREVDADIRVHPAVGDGDEVERDDVVLSVEGPARGILTAERLALNFLQRMSGIATHTRRYVDRVAGTDAAILDTRKTTPGHRLLEKYAVTCGGGLNHRMGLYDRIMLKDNHLSHWRRHHSGDLVDLVGAARAAYPGLAVEVEVESLEDLSGVLPANPDWVLLDNMAPDDLRRCVALNAGRCLLEASGGITLETVAAVAATGVDAISVGALTHGSVWLDFSLEFDDQD